MDSFLPKESKDSVQSLEIKSWNAMACIHVNAFRSATSPFKHKKPTFPGFNQGRSPLKETKKVYQDITR